MSQSSISRGRVDAWERWGWLWTALFFGVLVLTAGLVLGLGEQPAGERLAIVGLSAFLCFWYIGLLWAGRERLWPRPVLTVTWLLVGLAGWFGLVLLDPGFYFVLTGLFPLVFIYLPLRWAIGASGLITLLVVVEQSRGGVGVGQPFVWGSLLAMAIGILLGAWISAIIRQSAERGELIERLEAAQAELAAAMRREGVLAERERLAREIHDTLAQGFISIRRQLEALGEALPEDAAVARQHLGRADTTARESLAQARQVVQDLRPDLLAGQSLPAALERVAARWSADSGVAVRVATTGAVVPLHAGQDVVLLRALQEALANVRQHAQADAVSVTLSYMGDVVVLDVQDDGQGLRREAGETVPAGGHPQGGFGLAAMREQVEQLGGALLLESVPGEGTTLVVEIPTRMDEA